MVSRKSVGKKKTSDITDASVKKTRTNRISDANPRPNSTTPISDANKIILTDVSRGCGGQVSIVNINNTQQSLSVSDDAVDDDCTTSGGKQEQRDAISRLRRLGTDVSFEDQKVTKNLCGGDTVLVTPVEDVDHQPPAIKLLEDMAKSTELPVSSPVLTALGPETIKTKRKSQINASSTYDPLKLPPNKENVTNANETQNQTLKTNTVKVNCDISSQSKSINGESCVKIVKKDKTTTNTAQDLINDKKSGLSCDDSSKEGIDVFTTRNLSKTKVTRRSQLSQQQTSELNDENVTKPSNTVQIVTRSSVQQQNSPDQSTNSIKDDDKNDTPITPVQKPNNQKVTRSSVQNSEVQKDNDKTQPAVENQCNSTTKNDLTTPVQNVKEIPDNCDNKIVEKIKDDNNDNSIGDGIFLIRPQHYVKIVDGEQIWCCDICTVVSPQLPLFRRHYLRLHISPKFISEKDKESLNITEDSGNVNKLFKCHVCKEYFDKKIDLKLHLENHPNSSRDSQPSSKTLNKYVCSNCGAVFKWRKLYSKHTKDCQNDSKSSSKPSHHCLYCNETFHTPYLKKIHILSSHPYTRKKHPCIFCSRVFQSNITLFNHLSSAHSSIFFGCTTCKERFINLTELKAHYKKTHPTETLKVKNPSKSNTEKEFYECTKCDRMFLVENCLNKHDCVKQNIDKDCKEKIVRQKRIKPMLIERKIEGTKPVRETEFYSKVSSNIRDNLTYHLDGKLHPVDPPSGTSSVHRTILNFNAGVQSASVPVPQQDKPTVKSPNTPTYEKFNFRKEYDGRCGLTSFIKDASYLDISTQLIMRRNLQRLNLLSESSPDPQWDVPASLALERLGAQCAESFGTKCAESYGTTDPPLADESICDDISIASTSSVNTVGELSGEWVRDRTYVCSTCSWTSPCLWAMEDHKYSVHPHVWCPQHELNTPNHKQNSSFVYRRLIPIPREERRLSRREKYECTKCGINDIRSKPDLHRHMLECAGEDLGALELLHNAAVVRLPTAKRRSKWRGGSRRTRQGLKRNIPSTPPAHNSKRNKKLQRTKPGDADTIEKMIANLPAKRATRRVLGFDEVDIKTRSQATIQNNTTPVGTSGNQQTAKKSLKPSLHNSPPKKVEKKIQGIDTSAENGNVLSSLRMMPVVKKLDITDSTVYLMPTLEIEEEIKPEDSSNPEIPILTPATSTNVSATNQVTVSKPLQTSVLPSPTTAILLLVPPPLNIKPPPLVPIQSNKETKLPTVSPSTEPKPVTNVSTVQSKIKVETVNSSTKGPVKVVTKQILKVSNTVQNHKKLAAPLEDEKKKRGRPVGSKNKSPLNQVKKEDMKKKTIPTKNLRSWLIKEHSKDTKDGSNKKLKGWLVKKINQKKKPGDATGQKIQTKKTKKTVKKIQSQEKTEEVKREDKDGHIKEETIDTTETENVPEEVNETKDKIEPLEVAETKDSPIEQESNKKNRKRKSDEDDKLKQEKVESEKKRKLEVKKAKEEERLRKSAEKKRLIEERKQKRDELKKLKEEEKKKKEEEKRLEEEKKKKIEEEEIKKREEEERKKEEEERKRIELEEEAKRKAEEERIKKEDEMKRKEEEKKKKEEEAKKRKEAELLRKEEEKKKKEEETRKRKEEEAKRKEEERKKKEEETRKRKEEEAKRKEEERKKKEEETRKRKEEEAKRKEEEKRRKEEEVRKRKEEELKRKEEEKKKKEEETKKRKEEEAKRKEEEKKRKEEEAKRKAEEDRKKKEEEERKKKEEEELQRTKEQKRKEEEELKRKEEELRLEDEKRKAEDEKRRKDEELKAKIEEQKRRDTERRIQEEQRKQAEKLRSNETDKKIAVEFNERMRKIGDEASKQHKQKETDNITEGVTSKTSDEEIGETSPMSWSGMSSPLYGDGDDTKVSDSDSQKSFKTQQKKKKKQVDAMMKKVNRMSLSQKIRRKRLLMKIKETGATSSGKEVVSSGMKWEVEVSQEVPKSTASSLPTTSLPDEMDWLSGVAPSLPSIKPVPTSSLVNEPLVSSTQIPLSLHSRSVTPLNLPATSGNAGDNLWRDSTYPSTSTPNLGSILDSVNTLLNEPDLMYTPLVQPSPQPPQYSLADLQRAMGASDDEMAMLKQLGEIKVEEHRGGEDDWSDINIMDLDKQSVGGNSSAGSSSSTTLPVGNVSPSLNDSSISTTSTSNAGWNPKPGTSSMQSTMTANLQLATGAKGLSLLPGGKRSNCTPRLDGPNALLAAHPGKEVVCPTCTCHFMGFPALQLHISKYHPSRPTTNQYSALDAKLASVRRMSANICHKQDLSMLTKRALLESAKGNRLVCFMCQQILPANLMSSHLVVEHSSKPIDIAKCHPIGDPVRTDTNDGGERLKYKMSNALGDLLDRAVNNLLTAKQDSSNGMSGNAIQLLNKLCALKKKETPHQRIHPSSKEMLMKVYAKNRFEAALKKGAPKGLKLGNFTCGICGESFLWENSWSRHVLEIHTRPCGMPNVDDLPSDHDEAEDDWRIESEDEMEGGIEGDTGTNHVPSQLVPVCSDCGLGFDSMTDLIAHRNELHKPMRRGSTNSMLGRCGTSSQASSSGPPSRCSTPVTFPIKTSSSGTEGQVSTGGDIQSSQESTPFTPPSLSISPDAVVNDSPPIITPELAAPPRLTRRSASYFNPPTPPPPVLVPEGELLEEDLKSHLPSSTEDKTEQPPTLKSTNKPAASSGRKRANSKIPTKKEESSTTNNSSNSNDRGSRRGSDNSSTATSQTTTPSPSGSQSSSQSSSSGPPNKRQRDKKRRRGGSPDSTKPRRLPRFNEDESVKKRAEVALRELNLTQKTKTMNKISSGTSVRWTSAMTFSPRPKAEPIEPPSNPKTSASSAASAIYDFHEDHPT